MKIDHNTLKGAFNSILSDPNFTKMVSDLQDHLSKPKETEKEKVTIKPFQTYRHNTKRTIYIVKEVVNTKTQDNDKFPVSVVYFDKQLETTWCRPLSVFIKNFTLVG